MVTFKESMQGGIDNYSNFIGDDTEYRDFLVFLSRSRDSDILTESNFESALESLGGESETVQVHRFGHWGCGWYESILVNPKDKKAVGIAEEIEAALSDYPILDEQDFSEREYSCEIKYLMAETGFDEEKAGLIWSYFWDSEHEIERGKDYYIEEKDLQLAMLRVCPEEVDYNEVAEQVDTKGAYALANIIEQGKIQLEKYCAILPRFAEKATKEHEKAVLTIQKELAELALECVA